MLLSHVARTVAFTVGGTAAPIPSESDGALAPVGCVRDHDLATMEHPFGTVDGGSVGAATGGRLADGALDGVDSHLALIYESRAEQLEAVTAFVRTGLERGDRCVYVADDATTTEIVEAMELAGIDVSARRESGQLSLRSADDVSLADGSFDPDATIRHLAEVVREAVEENGFDHVRFAGEMTWLLDRTDAQADDGIAEYEAKLNEFFAEASATGLCQYSRERFPPAVLQDVLRTHPRIVADGESVSNPYYVPPAEILGDDVRAETIDRRLRAVRTGGGEDPGLGALGAVLRGILESVTAASSREAIDRAVCDELTAVDDWRFAWVGETSASSERVTSRAADGDGVSYVEEVTVPATADPSTEPAGRAAADRSHVVVPDVEAVPADAEWRDRALARGIEAVASVPIVYEGVSYGVLSVYADEPGAFDDRALALLADVGRAVAFACNAIERRRALVSDSATELEVQLPDGVPFVDFVTRLDAPVSIEGIVPDRETTADGERRLSVFVTVDGVAKSAVDDAAAATGLFSSLSLVSERDEGLAYDGVVDEPGLFETLLDHAVVPRSVAPDGDAGRAVVRLAPSTDVASFVRMLQDRYPGTDLVARRDVESRPTGRDDFRTELRDRLTDRQWDALQTAYLSGYFEWPRERSGEEVGARLDVSQPTFNRHLRDALRKVMTPIFDEER